MILTVPLFFRGMKVAAQLFSLSFPDVNKMFQDNSLIPNKGKPISPSVHCLLGLARTRQNSVANLGHVKPGTSILTRRLRWWHHPSTWVITPEKATWVITPENTSCTYISAKFHSHFFHRLSKLSTDWLWLASSLLNHSEMPGKQLEKFNHLDGESSRAFYQLLLELITEP